MFTFGTQYLRGATPARDQWARDMATMKSMGMNTIRAWLVWNAIEPAEGEIDYDYIISFLDLAKQNELNVGLLFHLHACPMWAIQKYQKYFYVDENQLPFEPAPRPNTPSGGWPGLCYDHDEVREMEERLIRGVIAETKKYDNVAFYEPMNEPHQWIDYTRNPNGIFCYCDASVRRFRDWLRTKYGDISALNDAWGYFYRSFDEVRPPRWTPSFSDYADFRLFNMDNVAAEIKFRSDIIRSCDTKPVIAHAWGGGAVTCANLGAMAFDDWKNAKIFDKWGYSAFPMGAGDASTLGMGSDATRCAADGKEYWQSELGSGIRGTGLGVTGRMDDNTFYNVTLESMRHGARGLLYWQFRMERFGPEWAGYAMTDPGGTPTNLGRCAERLGRVFTENEDIFCHSRIRDAEVALVFSIRSYLAMWSSSWKKDNKHCVDSLSGYYRMFWEENIPVDIIHEDQLRDLGRYKIVILPSAFAISPELAKRLESYVKNGGMLISDPYFGAFDEYFRLAYEAPGYGFERVFGCRRDDMGTRGSVTLLHGNNRYLLEGNYFAETYRDITGDILYTYENGSAAIIGNRYGKGYAVIGGVNLGLPYSNRSLISDDILSRDKANASTAAKDIVMELCKQAGIRGNICSCPGLKAGLLMTDTATALILINSNSAEASGNVELDDIYATAVSLFGNAHLSLNGDSLTVTVPARESAVIRLEK